MMHRINDTLRRYVLLFTLIILSGCASGVSSEAPYLLEQDYLRMTDAELISYEQELSDELVNASRTDNRDVGIGIGFGSWGGNFGYGIHADKWLGGSGESDMVRELRIRREDVRNEMRRRDLLPE